MIREQKIAGRAILIGGQPGTGKTATTLEVIRNIIEQRKAGSRKLPNFDFIHINAMSLTNPNLVYTILAEKILGRRMNP